MLLTSFSDIDRAVRASWSRDTCDPVDLPDWSAARPSRGHCGVTALLVHELLGGELLMASVTRTDGSHQGVHYWNQLAGGAHVDLTRDQFTDDEHVGEPQIVEVPPGQPGRLRTHYALLRQRVYTSLSFTPPSPGASR